MTDARLEEALFELTHALRRIVTELRLSQDEWMTTLAFLTEVGRADEFILLSDVLGLSVLVDAISHHEGGTATASNVLGPFYRPDAPMLDAPYHLAADDEQGEFLVMSGRVTSSETGEPLPGAILDVWQADDAGLYDVQYPGAAPHLRGRLPADPHGRYRMRTVVPPPYEIPNDGPVGRLLKALGRHAWRPAHLHLRATHEGFRPLTTMIYFEGDPWLGSDSIDSVKASLVVPLERREPDETCDRPYAQGTFDVALAPLAATTP
jgi:protocatechuate 3,4-dioxygenase beta subunit